MLNFGFRKRKKQKEKIEDYYKILGTRANAGPEKIREKYMEKVRAFPPETHPEEFQAVRRAYETLRDPIKRKQYDLQRKYGDKIEEIMEKVWIYLYFKDFKKAEELLHQVKEMDSDNLSIHLMLANVALFQNDMEGFYRRMDTAMAMAKEDEKDAVIAIKIKMLVESERFEEALDALEKDKTGIKDIRRYHQMRASILGELERYNDLWNLLQEMIPSLESQQARDIDIFIAWINTAIELTKWGEISKIQNRIRKLWSTVEDEDDRQMIRENLTWEMEGYIEVARFREAQIFVDLLCYMDPKNHELRERKKEIERTAKLDMELERMARDQEIFPIVYAEAMKLFLRTYGSKEMLDSFMDSLPHDIMKDFAHMDEEIAGSILRVKKKYPMVYKTFQKEWDEMFKMRTEGLNREARRRLR